MKKFGVITAFFMTVAAAGLCAAANVEFHGDLNNRFLIYTNHYDWLNAEQDGVLHDGTVDDNFGEIKYRFWTEAATDDGDLKGVFAVEIGGVRFGESSRGGSFSGDGINIETRWAYTDFQIPGIDQKARVKIGLQPWSVNRWLWNETAMGVLFEGTAGPVGYRLGWARGWEFENFEEEDETEDVDNLLAAVDFKAGDLGKIGVFGLYQTGDPPDEETPDPIRPEKYLLKLLADQAEIDIFNVGLTGSLAFPMGDAELFFKWDGIYQTGSIDRTAFTYDKLGVSNAGDFDLSAFFGHANLGVDFGGAVISYTFWYTSGDDDPRDDDLDGFLATDLDIAESVALFEYAYGDDDYFTERHYLLDKGFMMNKLTLEFKPTRKLRLGAAALYMMTAEDIEYIDRDGGFQSNDTIGFEVDGFVSYLLFENLEIATNAGYLFADDALDYFEVEEIRDGNSDEDIFVWSARVRYRF